MSKEGSRFAPLLSLIRWIFLVGYWIFTLLAYALGLVHYSLLFGCVHATRIFQCFLVNSTSVMLELS